jgi:hypothetical protein
MAHLEEILVHGVATQVWDMDSTAQQIDDVVGMMSGGKNIATGLASLGAKSRLNLLVNEHFTENSRGQQEYTAAGYTVDGWRLNAATGTVTVLPHGIRFASTSTAQLSQWIAAAYDDLANHTLTVSGYIDNVLYTATATIPSAKPTAYTTFARVDIADNCFLAFSWSASSQKFEVRINFSAAGSVFIAAAKLEFGDKSTLAYPEVVKAPNLAGSLLENGDFMLNSLGKTEYVGAVDTVDGWFSSNANLTVQVAEYGVHLTCKDSGNGYFRQFISKLPVGTYTISALVKGTGSMFMALTTKQYDSVFSGIVSTQLTDDWAIAQYTYNVTNDYNIECAYMRVNPGGSVDIQAIKLEKKSASTLEPLVDKTIWELVDQPDRPVEALRSACYYDGEWQGLIHGIGAQPRGNLLINPGFVDQRGSSPYVGAKYGPDCIYGLANVTKSLDNGVLTLSAKGTTSVTTHFLTGITDYSQVAGKQYTASVVDTSGVIYTVSGVVPSSVTSTIVTKSTPFGSIGIFFVKDKGLSVGIAAQKAALSIPRYGIKLERGPTQTLAYQDEDGNWQLFETPDYAGQLLKCQQYLFPLPLTGTDNYAPIGFGYSYSTNSVRVFIPTPVQMRDDPVIQYISGDLSGFSILCNGTGYTPTAVTNISALSGGVAIAFTVSGITGGYTCVLRTQSAYAMLSAQL